MIKSTYKIGFWLLSLTILMIACSSPSPVSIVEEEISSVMFQADSTFKIVQFTDVHWNNDSAESCALSAANLRNALETEKPDLVVFTGDVVTGPAEAGWKAVTYIVSEAGVPFAVTLGNHDDEADWSRNQIFDFLASVPGFLGEKGPEEVYGVGNYFIALKSYASDEIKAILWFFDSNAYCEDKNISDYGWIRFDQIAWFREESAGLTARNGGHPYPALAFFHIPLPEYDAVIGKEGTLGLAEERVCSPQINTGMLAAFIEMGDVMGTFVGHDHDNNYIGVHKGIALAYGQSSGYETYGSIGRGARVIVLEEDKLGFDTWIRKPEGVSFEYRFVKQ